MASRHPARSASTRSPRPAGADSAPAPAGRSPTGGAATRPGQPSSSPNPGPDGQSRSTNATAAAAEPSGFSAVPGSWRPAGGVMGASGVRLLELGLPGSTRDTGVSLVWLCETTGAAVQAGSRFAGAGCVVPGWGRLACCMSSRLMVRAASSSSVVRRCCSLASKSCWSISALRLASC
jgi:hypothetical protein